MKNIALYLFLILLFYACTIPYNLQDSFKEKANLPEDEAPHIKNSLEWWYFTGHLNDTIKNKKLGVEYVVFHFNPTNIKGGWMVNMAVSDPENGKFYYDHKFFQKKKYEYAELPLDFSWKKGKFNASMQGQSGEYKLKGGFKEGNVSMQLQTQAIKDLVLHDGIGYEDYGGIAKAGYYTYPRLATEGQLSLNDEVFDVSGDLWYDRQWNCSGVFNKQIAWDWFAIQFEESNSELMLYRLYNLKTGEELFGGTYLDSLNNQINLENEEIEIKELSHWISPESRAKYPTKWAISIKRLKLEATVQSLLNEQELKLSFGPITKFYYWEGMCEAEARLNNQKVKGNAYVEMTNRFRVK